MSDDRDDPSHNELHNESNDIEENQFFHAGQQQQQHGQTSAPPPSAFTHSARSSISSPLPSSPPPQSPPSFMMTVSLKSPRKATPTPMGSSSNHSQSYLRRGSSEEVLRNIRRDARRNTVHNVPSHNNNNNNNDGNNNLKSSCTKIRKKLLKCIYDQWNIYYTQNQRRRQSLNRSNLKNYCQSYFLRDVIAGLTVGVMVVPQGMSYAKLAGLPVQYGLYGALFPVWAYAVFGSSRQLAVGPVALVSLMLESGLSRIVYGDSGGDANNSNNADAALLYENLAIQTSFLIGMTYIILGLLRLGFITVFLSHAVTSGFTTGASVIIGCSQLKYILGYDVPRSDVLHEIIKYTFEGISEFNYRTFLMGGGSLLLLLGLKYLGKKYPSQEWIRATGPLFVSVLTIVMTYFGDLSNHGIPIVGNIPRGFPSFTATSWFPMDHFGDLARIAAGIAVVGFMESIAVAKQLASRHKYDLDASTELIGLGMANLAGAMFQSYPVTGSLSRSAVNDDAGAKSRVSGIITATLVGLVLLLLTSVFQYMPLSVLAAIVISGVSALFDCAEALYLWSVHKFDFFVWVVAFLGTMFLGVEIGLAIAIVLSLGVVLFESAYPHTAVLGRLFGTTTYRSVEQYPDSTERYGGIVIVRVDAPLFFANAQHVRDKVREYEEREEQGYLEQQRRGIGRGVAEASLEAADDERFENFISHQDVLSSVQRRRGRDNEQNSSLDICDSTSQSLAEGTNYSDYERIKTKFIILDLSPVTRIDTTSLHILSDMNDSYTARGVTMCLCNPNKVVMQRLLSSGLGESIGRENIFVDIHYAVENCFEKMAPSRVLGGMGQEEKDDLSSASSSNASSAVDGNYHLLT